MKTLKHLIGIVALALVAVQMAPAQTNQATTGTCYIESEVQRGNWQVITFEWTSHSSGGNVWVDNKVSATGRIVAVITNPGSTAPSDNWDMTITDYDGQDLLYGLGANRDTANTEALIFLGNNACFSTSTLTQTVNTLNTASYLSPVVAGPISLNLTNCGNSKTGKVKIILEQ